MPITTLIGQNMIDLIDGHVRSTPGPGGVLAAALHIDRVERNALRHLLGVGGGGAAPLPLSWPDRVIGPKKPVRRTRSFAGGPWTRRIDVAEPDVQHRAATQPAPVYRGGAASAQSEGKEEHLDHRDDLMRAFRVVGLRRIMEPSGYAASRRAAGATATSNSRRDPYARSSAHGPGPPLEEVVVPGLAIATARPVAVATSASPTPTRDAVAWFSNPGPDSDRADMPVTVPSKPRSGAT